jgi:hypothetical protein
VGQRSLMVQWAVELNHIGSVPGGWVQLRAPRSIRAKPRPILSVRRFACFAILSQLAPLPVAAQSPSSLQPGTQAPTPPEPVKVSLRGIMLIDMNYNTATLFPGSMATFAVRPDLSVPQFFVSPQNSVLGIDLRASPVAGAEVVGALAITLRSPQPLLTANTISPQFYDVHLEANTKMFHIGFGQMPDVVYPATPDVLNGAPPGYLPGAIGYTRPQLQGGVDFRFSEHLTLMLRGCAAQAIQTFEVSDTLLGRQKGVPDFQGRIALGNGEPVAAGATIRPRERPIEIGIDGHWGRRLIETLPPNVQDFTFTTWSLGGDLHAKLPTGTTIRGEIFTGSVLGDYQAGVFHTVDATLLKAVRAWGFWAQIDQALNDRLRLALAYGLDDPKRSDLAPVSRARNQAVLLTSFLDITQQLGAGLEVSRWWTEFVGANTATAWRIDTAVFVGFGGL